MITRREFMHGSIAPAGGFSVSKSTRPASCRSIRASRAPQPNSKRPPSIMEVRHAKHSSDWRSNCLANSMFRHCCSLKV